MVHNVCGREKVVQLPLDMQPRLGHATWKNKIAHVLHAFLRPASSRPFDVTLMTSVMKRWKRHAAVAL